MLKIAARRRCRRSWSARSTPAPSPGRFAASRPTPIPTTPARCAWKWRSPTAAPHAQPKLVRDDGTLTWEFPRVAGHAQRAADEGGRLLGADAAAGGAGARRCRAAPADGRATSTPAGAWISTSQDADIHNILRSSPTSGRSTSSLSDDVKGTVTMHLRDVPWDQALDVICQGQGARRAARGQPHPRRAAGGAREGAGGRRWRAQRRRSSCKPLETRLIPLSYADGTQILPRMQEVHVAARPACRSTRAPTSSSSPTWRRNIALAEDLVAQPRHADAAGARSRRASSRRRTTFTRDIGIQWGGNTHQLGRHRQPDRHRLPVDGRRGRRRHRRGHQRQRPAARRVGRGLAELRRQHAGRRRHRLGRRARPDARLAQRQRQHQPAPVVAGEHRQRAHRLGAEDHDARQHRGVDRAGHVDPDLGRVARPAPTPCSSTPSSTSRSSRT